MFQPRRTRRLGVKMSFGQDGGAPVPRACCSAKTSLVKQDLADFKPMEAGGFLIGDNGSLGGFEALRLVRFVFRGVGFWRSDRMLVVAREGGFCRPSGAGFHGGSEPSAHALGYHLTALRAWSHGLGEGCVGLVSGRWCSSWLRGGGGLNHPAHKGHELAHATTQRGEGRRAYAIP